MDIKELEGILDRCAWEISAEYQPCEKAPVDFVLGMFAGKVLHKAKYGSSGGLKTHKETLVHPDDMEMFK